jgi:hypothetical protein
VVAARRTRKRSNRFRTYAVTNGAAERSPRFFFSGYLDLRSSAGAPALTIMLGSDVV